MKILQNKNTLIEKCTEIGGTYSFEGHPKFTNYHKCEYSEGTLVYLEPLTIHAEMKKVKQVIEKGYYVFPINVTCVEPFDPKCDTITEPTVEQESPSTVFESTVSTNLFYEIITNADWQGDYVDYDEKPKPIKGSGNTKLGFKCSEENKFFGAFFTVAGQPIEIIVWDYGVILDSEKSTSRSTLILEGVC